MNIDMFSKLHPLLLDLKRIGLALQAEAFFDLRSFSGGGSEGRGESLGDEFM